MAKGIFITGTGTDIGKTFISGLIVRELKNMGLSVNYYKPVLSGAIESKQELIPGDVKEVYDFAGLQGDYKRSISYLFKEPVSPHLAAQLNNEVISLDMVTKDYHTLAAEYDYLCVEGCGGLICPISKSNNQILLLEDIIKRMQLGVIIVASAELGTINHTVLTVEYAKQKRISVKGIILNYYNKDNLIHADNKYMIETLTGVKVLACVAKNKDKNSASFNIDKNELLSLFVEIGEKA